MRPPISPEISFCLITHGRRPKKLADSIASIHAQRIPSYEIIIAGSPPEGVGTHIRQVLMHDAAKRADLGAMRNGAVRAARAQIVVVSDDDIIFDRGFFQGVMERIYGFDLLAVTIKNPDGSRYWDWAEFNGPKGHRNIPFGVPSPYVYVTGGICVGWREKLLRVGWVEGRGINEAEDVDFSVRFRGANLLIGACPNAIVIHNDSKYSGLRNKVVIDTSCESTSLQGFNRHPGTHIEAPLFSQSSRSLLGHGITESLRSKIEVLSLRSVMEVDSFCPYSRALFNDEQSYDKCLESQRTIGPVLYVGYDQDSWSEIGFGRIRYADASRITLCAPPELPNHETDWLKTALSFDKIALPTNADIATYLSRGVPLSRLIKIPLGISVPTRLRAASERLEVGDRPLIVAPIFEDCRSLWVDIIEAFLQTEFVRGGVTLVFLCGSRDIQTAINERVSQLSAYSEGRLSCEALFPFSHLALAALLRRAKLFINTHSQGIDPFLTALAVSLEVPVIAGGGPSAEEILGGSQQLIIPASLRAQGGTPLRELLCAILSELAAYPTRFKEMGRTIRELHQRDFDKDSIDSFFSNALG